MRILITAKNSFIGKSVKAWLNEKEPSFIVEEISLRKIDLRTISFKSYDVIFHVAGIAHVSSNKKLIPEYFRVNRDLAIEVANKAKKEGVKKIIFTSSMSIYGDDRPIGDFKPIKTNNPSPTNAYGQSKLEADIAIQKLQDPNFDCAILRIPMVYGTYSKGNFLKLVKISNKLPIFPKLVNKRSILHIKNLAELIRLILVKNLTGVFYPQDKKYLNTNDLIFLNRSINGKKTIFIPFFSLILSFLGLFNKTVNKIYGNKFFESNQSIVRGINYQLFSLEDVIRELKGI
jgi:nucleoside-diphosphate-sugar epimerase